MEAVWLAMGARLPLLGASRVFLAKEAWHGTAIYPNPHTHILFLQIIPNSHQNRQLHSTTLDNPRKRHH